MDLENLKKKVKELLINMDCTDITFPDPKEDLLVVTFNCKNLLSFKAELEGWTYSGIHLDPTSNRQYKIDFIKTNSKVVI